VNRQYLPFEQFDVKKVDFYVIGTKQPVNPPLSYFYDLWASLRNAEQIDLKLVADTDQPTRGNYTEMNSMGNYAKGFLDKAKKDAAKRGYIVTAAYWDGIIHPDNLEIMRQNAPIIWSFSANGRNTVTVR